MYKNIGLGAMLCLVCSFGHAVPLTWNVSGGFDDGGQLSGNFIFDADLGLGGLSSVAITTTAGSVFGGSTYAVGDVFQFQNETIGLGFLLILRSLTDGTDLTLNIKNPGVPVLSNAGGAFTAVPADWDEFNPTTGARRRLDATVGGTLSSVPVPEPASALLLGLGLLGLNWARKAA